MCKVPPYELWCGVVRKQQETMMVDPDNTDKQIADCITQGSGPQRKQGRQLRLGWRFQRQNHDRDDYGEDGIRKCCQPLCRTSSVSHDRSSLRRTFRVAPTPCPNSSRSSAARHGALTEKFAHPLGDEITGVFKRE